MTGCQNLLLNLRWLRPGVMDPITAGPANGWNWTVINNCEELIMIQTLSHCIELNHVIIINGENIWIELVGADLLE